MNDKSANISHFLKTLSRAYSSWSVNGMAQNFDSKSSKKNPNILTSTSPSGIGESEFISAPRVKRTISSFSKGFSQFRLVRHTIGCFRDRGERFS